MKKIECLQTLSSQQNYSEEKINLLHEELLQDEEWVPQVILVDPACPVLQMQTRWGQYPNAGNVPNLIYTCFVLHNFCERKEFIILVKQIKSWLRRKCRNLLMTNLVQISYAKVVKFVMKIFSRIFVKEN